MELIEANAQQQKAPERPRKVKALSPRATCLIALAPFILLLPVALLFASPLMRLLFYGPMSVPYTRTRTWVFAAIFLVVGLLGLALFWLLQRSAFARALAARPRLLGLAFGSSSLLALLLLADGIIGIPFAGFQRIPEIMRPDSVMEYRHHPNSQAVFAAYPLDTNSLGLRGPEIGPPSPERRRVIFIGDSVVYSMGVPAGTTLPERMQARLGPTWEIINGGVIGYQFHQYYYHVQEMLALQPDEIILGITLNDFTLVRVDYLDGDPRLPSTRPRRLTPANRLLFFIKFHSGLLNLHKLVDSYFWLTEPEDLIAFDEGQVYRLLDDPKALEYHLLVMKRFMTAIKQHCHEAGVPLRAVVFPYRFMFLPEERERRPNWREMTQRIQLLMEDIGIPTLDPFDPMDRVVQAHGGNPRSVLLDHNHFNVLGHDALAEIIVRAMLMPGPLGAPIPPQQ